MTLEATQQKSVFPRKGDQVRRKADGALGEIYASDSRKGVLTVRWPTIPGAYATHEYTPDQFDRRWELTGAHLRQCPPSKYAAGILGTALLLFFIAVLAKIRWSSYTAYDASKILLADSLAPLDNAVALYQKYGAAAAAQCAAGADAYLRSIVGANYRWSGTASAGSHFGEYRAGVAAPGVLTMVSDAAGFLNGAGGFHPVEISCDYDTRRQVVVHYGVQIIGP